MADEKKENRRAETARINDDSGIGADTDMPSQSGRSGGGIARDVGTTDDQRRVGDGETGTTRVTESHKENEDRKRRPG